MKIELWFIDNRIDWKTPLTWFSWIIQLFSWWNHVAIRVTTEEEDYFIHAQLRVSKESYADFVKSADRTVMIMQPVSDLSHRVEWLNNQLGKWYDVPAIILQLAYQFSGVWLWFDTGLQKLWFCSELGAGMLELEKAHVYDPEDLSKSDKLAYSRMAITKKGLGELQLIKS